MNIPARERSPSTRPLPQDQNQNLNVQNQTRPLIELAPISSSPIENFISIDPDPGPLVYTQLTPPGQHSRIVPTSEATLHHGDSSSSEDFNAFMIPDEITNMTKLDIEKMTQATKDSALWETVQLLKRATEHIERYKSIVSRLELQNQLLAIEAHESSQRNEVEKSLIQREVDRLRFEQFNHQNTSASTSVPSPTGIEGDVYKRQLHRTKQKLKEANRKIVARDKNIDTFKKLLNEGQLERDALEEALHKRDNIDDPTNISSHHNNPDPSRLSHKLDHSDNPDTDIEPEASSRSDPDRLHTLGLMAFKASTGAPPESQLRPLMPPLQLDPRGVPLPPIDARLSRRHTTPPATDPPGAALMSPLTFRELPDSSPPTLGLVSANTNANVNAAALSASNSSNSFVIGERSGRRYSGTSDEVTELRTQISSRAFHLAAAKRGSPTTRNEANKSTSRRGPDGGSEGNTTAGSMFQPVRREGQNTNRPYSPRTPPPPQ